jgi:hypothetical protein
MIGIEGTFCLSGRPDQFFGEQTGHGEQSCAERETGQELPSIMEMWYEVHLVVYSSLVDWRPVGNAPSQLLVESLHGW